MNFSLNSSVLSCLIFTSLFLPSTNFIYGQQSVITESNNQVAISVNVGTTIISSDPSFNTQINETNIVTDGIVSSFEDDGKSQIIMVLDNQKKIKRKPFKDLSSENKDVDKKLLAKAIKNVEKKIVEYKKLASNNLADNIHKQTSSGLFSIKDSTLSSAIPSSNNHHDTTKIHLSNDGILRLAPIDLQRIQYFFYNSKSLTFCFSKVFSVRPPPVLV